MFWTCLLVMNFWLEIVHLVEWAIAMHGMYELAFLLDMFTFKLF